MPVASVIHDDVERAEPIHGSANRREDRSAVGDVQADR